MSASFFQGEKDYCESTRNTDLMLETFKKDRKTLLQLLKESPKKLTEVLWSSNSPICKDENCLFQMGKDLKLSMEDILGRELRKQTICDSMSNLYICPQCKNMRRLIDFSKTKAGEPFLLECGEKAGTSLIYNEKNIGNTYLKYEKEPLAIKKAYAHPQFLKLVQCNSASCHTFVNSHTSVKLLPDSSLIDEKVKTENIEENISCSLPTTKDVSYELKKYAEMSYLASDPFTNNMLINWYLQDEITFPNIFTNFMSWICNSSGYNLYEYLDIFNINSFQEFPNFLTNTGKPSPTAKADDKSPLSLEIVRGIVVQLFAILHTLRKYDFSHGNPSTSVLKFKKESVSYITHGVHVTCPVTLKLTDFENAGCTILDNKVRLYSTSLIAEEQLKQKNFEFMIDTVELEGDTQHKVTIYRLRDPSKYFKSSVMFMYMKHLGLPVYAASFDAYAFMIVLLCERSFYSTLVADKTLSTFWRNMWVTNEDYTKIMDRISEYHEKTSIVTTNDVLKILADVNLRCDMIDFGWNLIRSF
jgi:hypothetical protein